MNSHRQIALHFSSWARTFTQFRLELLLALESKNVKNVLTFTPEAPHTDDLNKLGLSIVEEQYSKNLDLNILRSIYVLRRIIIRKQPTVIMLHQPIALFIGVLSNVLINKKVFYFTGGLKTNESMSFFHAKINFFIERFFLNRCDVVFSVNTEDVVFMKKNGVRSKVCYVGPRGGCGIDTDKFKFSQENNRSIRSKMKISADNIVIGMVGRIEEEKGLFQVFNEFVKIASKNNNVVLLIIGAGSQSAALLQRIKALPINLMDRVHFVGRQEDIQRWYSSIDIFILASKREGMPTSLLEAMSTSCLVLSTRVRGAREVIISNENGFLYSSTEDLCNDIGNIVGRLDNLKSIRIKARKTLETSYSKNVLLPHTMNLINSEMNDIYS